MTERIEYHRARRLALQGLCALDVQGERAMPPVLEFLDESREQPGTIRFARAMLHGAFHERPRIDELLGGETRHWDVARMAIVDRNILRLTVWELLQGGTGRKIVITEAVKLAKEFSTAEASRFINGVLDAAARRILPDETDNAAGSQDTGPVTE